MKKKGRVCGTIGFLLAAALVGGTVVYSSMFDKYAAAKAQKPIGSATGNVVTAITKNEGFDETKKFVTEANTLIDGTGTGTYKSYSSKFSARYEDQTKEEDTTRISVVELSGVLYTDASYTYVTVEATLYTERSTAYERVDAVYDKGKNELWKMATSGRYPQNGADTSYFKDAKWQKTTDTVHALGATSLFALIADAFDTTATVKFDYLSGALTFDRSTADVEDVCTFTVGYSPRVTRVVTEKSSTEAVSVNVTIDYSDLNNTVVNLPETLVAAKGA